LGRLRAESTSDIQLIARRAAACKPEATVEAIGWIADAAVDRVETTGWMTEVRVLATVLTTAAPVETTG
jgi:hypothetical protein